MSESNKGPEITGRRNVSTHSVSREPLAQQYTSENNSVISGRRHIDIRNSSSESITIGDQLPVEISNILESITQDAPNEWKQQATEAAYFIWSLDTNKEVFDSQGNSLNEKRQKFVDQLASSGFVWGVYSRSKFRDVDPHKALPQWIYSKNDLLLGNHLNETEKQNIEYFYDSYVHQYGTEFISTDGQHYFDYKLGVQTNGDTFAGSHKSKGYIEGINLKDTKKLGEALNELRYLHIHPNTTKLFESDRLVLYWEGSLTDEQKIKVQDTFKKKNIQIRSFAHDVPEVQIKKDGYEIKIRASNDGSLGDGGHNPFDWEDMEYKPDTFLRKYLQLTYWAGKNPTNPYDLSFVPVIIKDESIGKDDPRVKDIQRRISMQDRLSSVVSHTPYLNCFEK